MGLWRFYKLAALSGTVVAFSIYSRSSYVALTLGSRALVRQTWNPTPSPLYVGYTVPWGYPGSGPGKRCAWVAGLSSSP